mgnify:CR=1 FL=1
MKKILFLLHIPPPVHGSSMVGKWIKESVLINREFDCDYLNLLASKDVGQSGEISFGKLYTLLITFFKFRSGFPNFLRASLILFKSKLTIFLKRFLASRLL